MYHHFFIKFFSEQKYAQSFTEGMLHAKRLSYFKRLEEQVDSNRSDRHEGVVEWLQPGRVELILNGIKMSDDINGPLEVQANFLNYYNVFCVYSAFMDIAQMNQEDISVDYLKRQLLVEERCLQIGKYAVLIYDLPKFIERIEEARRQNGIRGWRGRILYYDPNTFHGRFEGLDPIFRKRVEYHYQKEYRFVFENNLVGCNALDLYIGDLADISFQCHSSQVNGMIEASHMKLHTEV